MREESKEIKGRRTVLQLRYARCVLELVETPLKHVLGRQPFNPHQVQNHVVPEVERRIEPIRLTLNHSLRRRRFKLLIRHHNDDSTVVESTTTSTTGHLDVLASGEVTEVATVEFTNGGEDDSFGGHVETDGERLGGEEDLEETFLEEDLDDLFEDGEETTVMDSDTALEERQDVLDLGQLTVVVGEVRDGVGEDGVDHVALFVRVELELRHLESETFALALREGEDDDGVVIFDHDHLRDLVDVGRTYDRQPVNIPSGEKRSRETHPCYHPSSSDPSFPSHSSHSPGPLPSPCLQARPSPSQSCPP
jgi:hypothetical protein